MTSTNFNALLPLLISPTLLNNHFTADLVLYNFELPEQPQTKAIAIREGKIVCLSSTLEILHWISEKTKAFDLSGKFLFTGIFEPRSPSNPQDDSLKPGISPNLSVLNQNPFTYHQNSKQINIEMLIIKGKIEQTELLPAFNLTP